MGLLKKLANVATKDAMARANVEAMRNAKRKSEGKGRMDPALADQLNRIQDQHGSKKRFL